MEKSGFLERLKDGGCIIIAEGYMWELERRGYVKFGTFTPEVVLQHPEVVRIMHEEFVRSGSDVVEAYTYLGSRKKLRDVGFEDELEKLNRSSLRIARDVADKTGTLMAGDICHTWNYDPENEDDVKEVKSMFKEQIEWAVQEGADYIIGETFESLGEAMVALKSIKQHGNGLPAVITLTAYLPDTTLDDVPIPEACRRLEEAGAAVVGLNCARGPNSMLPLLKDIRKVTKGPLAAIPVPFRCKDKYKTFQSLLHPDTGESVYPQDLACQLCSRKEIKQFAEEAKSLGVQYIGVCCGNSPAYMREVAQVYGRTPKSCEYSTDMTKSQSKGTGGKSKYAAKFNSMVYDVDASK